MKGLFVSSDFMPQVKVIDYDEPLYRSVGNSVGGWIELVHPQGLPQPFVFVCNDEGRIIGLPYNPIASTLYRGFIAGNVVLMKEGYTDEGVDLVGLEEEDIETLAEIIGVPVELIERE